MQHKLTYLRGFSERALESKYAQLSMKFPFHTKVRKCIEHIYSFFLSYTAFMALTNCMDVWTYHIFIESAHWADSIIESQSLSVCLYGCLYVPFHAFFFEASHWPSDHMTRSRPLIGQPSLRGIRQGSGSCV